MPFTKLSKLLIISLFILGSLSPTLNAQQAGNTYTVKAKDGLWKIATIAYNNPKLYTKIVEATNEKALTDKSYQSINNINALKIGQKIWIPNIHLTPAKDEQTEAQLVSIPKTDCEIRIWYNYQVIAITRLNEKWEKDGISLKERAHKAFELRHDARVNARFMMQDQTAVAQLQNRDLQKYGNPNGPTLDYLLNKLRKKGLSDEAAYQKIIQTSSKVSPVYNNECL